MSLEDLLDEFDAMEDSPIPPKKKEKKVKEKKVKEKKVKEKKVKEKKTDSHKVYSTMQEDYQQEEYYQQDLPLEDEYYNPTTPPKKSKPNLFSNRKTTPSKKKKKQVQYKCTNPVFKKDDIHSDTLPVLEIGELSLKDTTQTLYPDELQQRQHSYEPENTYSSVDDILDTIENIEIEEVGFDVDEFLDTIDEVEDNDNLDIELELPDRELELPDLEPEMELELELELPDLEPEIEVPHEPTIPDIEIDEEILNLGETMESIPTEKTRITFNKEYLAQLTGGKS